tara:strand:- start:1831 stop:2244 length:414 start_codon:yes stop_codon:yes gene_type:complete
MKIESKFFDKLEWSLYGTLQTFIIIIILKIGNKNLKLSDIQFLTFSSILGMLSSTNILSRLIYSFFLCLCLWTRDKYFLLNTILTLISILLLSIIFKYYDNIVKILSINIIKYFLITAVIFWFLYFIYIIFNKLFSF